MTWLKAELSVPRSSLTSPDVLTVSLRHPRHHGFSKLMVLARNSSKWSPCGHGRYAPLVPYGSADTLSLPPTATDQIRATTRPQLPSKKLFPLCLTRSHVKPQSLTRCASVQGVSKPFGLSTLLSRFFCIQSS